jgi:hypothetical protein
VAGAILFIAVPAEACGCICPTPRAVFGEADAAVVARFEGKVDRTVFRYTVREWLKGDGPRRILAIDHPSIRPGDGPIGLALERLGGGRFRVLDCGHARADEARLAAAPFEQPTGEPPAGLFVGTGFAGPDHAKAGAWLDRDGRLLAWDRFETQGLSVCPGGRLAVQVGATPGWESEEVLVRDLATLEIMERLPLRGVDYGEQVTCRDAAANEVLLLAEGDPSWRIVDARAGTELVRYGDDDYTTYEARIGRDAAAMLESDWDRYARGRTLDRVDLDTGAITRVLDVADRWLRAWAFDPVADQVAILTFDPTTAEDVLTVVSIASETQTAMAPRTMRLPSDAGSRIQATNRPPSLIWTGSTHLALWSWRDKVVNVIDTNELRVVCEWRPQVEQQRRGPWLSLMVDPGAGVLLGSFGTEVIAGHAAGGPLKAIHGFSPEPSDTVVALPGFDADRLLGEAGPCETPEPPAGSG